MKSMGIDEAGRGCVLGALVIGAFVTDDVDPTLLRQAGADDSKKLTPIRRIEARGRLESMGTADVRLVSAEEIDQGNLNQLEEAVIADLIRRWKPGIVYVDALGPPSSFPKLIARLVEMVGNSDFELIIEPKADSTYPIVGAASVFAKTTRDQLLEELKTEFGELGSGYPSDPTTKKWLFDWSQSGQPWPSFVRTRWGTVTNLAQQSLF